MGEQKNEKRTGKKGKKGEEKQAKPRRHKTWRWPENRKRNLKSEMHKAERKLDKLFNRGRLKQPGGIMPMSNRYKRLSEHISNLREQAMTVPAWACR